MTTVGTPTVTINSGYVQPWSFSPQNAQILEGLRIRHKHASKEDVLRDALYDLAEANDIVAPRIPVTDEDRARLAAQGLVPHENIASVRFQKSIAQKPGHVYVCLIVFYPSDNNWPNLLAEKLGCDKSLLIAHALDLYMTKPPPK